MLKPALGRRRSPLEIVYEILSACDNGGNRKTTIMYRSSLNHDQLQRYLHRLSAGDLIDLDEIGHFHLTPRGYDALEQVSGVVDMLKALASEPEPIAVGT